MIYRNEGRMNISVATSSGEGHCRHDGVHLCTTTIGSIRAGDAKRGLPTERVPHKEPQKDIRRVESRFAPKYTLGAMDKNRHNRFEEGARQVKHVSDLEPHSHAINASLHIQFIESK